VCVGAGVEVQGNQGCGDGLALIQGLRRAWRCPCMSLCGLGKRGWGTRRWPTGAVQWPCAQPQRGVRRFWPPAGVSDDPLTLAASLVVPASPLLWPQDPEADVANPALTRADWSEVQRCACFAWRPSPRRSPRCAALSGRGTQSPRPSTTVASLLLTGFGAPSPPSRCLRNASASGARLL
jgi:hypothetical protein